MRTQPFHNGTPFKGMTMSVYDGMLKDILCNGTDEVFGWFWNVVVYFHFACSIVIILFKGKEHGIVVCCEMIFWRSTKKKKNEAWNWVLVNRNFKSMTSSGEFGSPKPKRDSGYWA